MRVLEAKEEFRVNGSQAGWGEKYTREALFCCVVWSWVCVRYAALWMYTCNYGTNVTFSLIFCSSDFNSYHHGYPAIEQHFPGATSGSRHRLLLCSAVAGGSLATGQNVCQSVQLVCCWGKSSSLGLHFLISSFITHLQLLLYCLVIVVQIIYLKLEISISQ